MDQNYTYTTNLVEELPQLKVIADTFEIKSDGSNITIPIESK